MSEFKPIWCHTSNLDSIWTVSRVQGLVFIPCGRHSVRYVRVVGTCGVASPKSASAARMPWALAGL